MIKKILLCSEGWAPLLSQQRSAISYLGQNWPVRQLHWELQRSGYLIYQRNVPFCEQHWLMEGCGEKQLHDKRGEERRSEVR